MRPCVNHIDFLKETRSWWKANFRLSLDDTNLCPAVRLHYTMSQQWVDKSDEIRIFTAHNGSIWWACRLKMPYWKLSTSFINTAMEHLLSCDIRIIWTYQLFCYVLQDRHYGHSHRSITRQLDVSKSSSIAFTNEGGMICFFFCIVHYYTTWMACNTHLMDVQYS